MLTPSLFLSQYDASTMIESNLKLVWSIAQKYAQTSDELQEYFQEGTLGLIKAVEKFNPDLGYQFSTYATYWIRKYVLDAKVKARTALSLPQHTLTRAHAAQRLLNAGMTLEQTAAQLNTRCSTLTELLHSSKPALSLDCPSEDGTFLRDILEDAQSEEDHIEVEKLQQRVKNLLTFLDQRERKIIILRYGLDGGEEMSRADVGERVGLTGERIRQIEVKALAKMRNAASCQYV